MVANEFEKNSIMIPLNWYIILIISGHNTCTFFTDMTLDKPREKKRKQLIKTFRAVKKGTHGSKPEALGLML